MEQACRASSHTRAAVWQGDEAGQAGGGGARIALHSLEQQLLQV